MDNWVSVCNIGDILPQTGVCALVNDQQVAIFRPTQENIVYAISNIDPFAQASVLSRGLIAEHKGDLWVASPLKKQHFRLRDGVCLEDENYNIKSYSIRVKDQKVEVKI